MKQIFTRLALILGLGFFSYTALAATGGADAAEDTPLAALRRTHSQGLPDEIKEFITTEFFRGIPLAQQWKTYEQLVLCEARAKRQGKDLPPALKQQLQVLEVFLNPALNEDRCHDWNCQVDGYILPLHLFQQMHFVDPTGYLTSLPTNPHAPYAALEVVGFPDPAL